MKIIFRFFLLDKIRENRKKIGGGVVSVMTFMMTIMTTISDNK